MATNGLFSSKEQPILDEDFDVEIDLVLVSK